MITHVVLGGFFFLGSLYELRYAKAIWRGERGLLDDDPYRIPEWWPFGGATWRAMPRTSLITIPGGTCLGLWYLLDGFDTSGVVSVLESVALAGFGVYLALLVAILLWNEPRFLVPPHLRGFPGAFAEWFDDAPVPDRSESVHRRELGTGPADQTPGEDGDAAARGTQSPQGTGSLR